MSENQTIELAEEAVAWWEQHQYDTTGPYGEYNVYDSEPGFVTRAREIIVDYEEGENMEKDIFVVVAENDQKHFICGKEYFDDGGPLVFEQYTRTADLASIKKRAAQMQPRYGKCRIAKLQFVDA